MKNIREETDDEKVPIILVASKYDEAPTQDLEKYEEKAKSLNVEFFCTSSKTGYNVEKVFMHVAQKVLENEVKIEKKSSRFKIKKPKFIKKAGCC